jgi:hypothetical protein
MESTRQTAWKGRVKFIRTNLLYCYFAVNAVASVPPSPIVFIAEDGTMTAEPFLA